MITTKNNQSFRVVVGFDFSDLGRLALAEAIGLASVNPRTVLHFLAVADTGGGLGPVVGKGRSSYEATAEVQATIKALVEEYLAAYDPPDVRYFVHVRIGAAGEELVRLAAEAHADLVIVGTHGRTGVRRLVMGSVAEHVVRTATCPVLVMRPRADAADEDAPAFEPEAACPHCVVRRLDTDGVDWWCDAHKKPYVEPHRYAYRPAPQATPIDGWSTFNR